MKKEKLKIGNYVRTEYGIAKIIELEPWNAFDFALDKDIFYFRAGNPNGDFTSYGFFREIIKSSENVIDLIEVGDFVDDVCIEKIYSKRENNIHVNAFEDEIMLEFTNVNITSIVTKEQFESMEYKI